MMIPLKPFIANCKKFGKRLILAEDITIFNTFIQTQRLFQFLAEVNDFLDKERRDLLNQDPLPTLDKA